VTNFGTDPVPLPQGTVILASAPIDGGQLPPDTTAWLLLPGAWHSPNGSG
jgi:alpha-glucosidase